MKRTLSQEFIPADHKMGTLASIPGVERWLFRYVMGPAYFALTSAERSTAKLEEMTQAFERELASISSAQEKARVQIPRLLGLEPSSLHWSMAMLGEHLVTAGVGIQRIIADLEKHGRSEVVVKTANLKPAGMMDNPWEKFRRHVEGYIAWAKRRNWTAIQGRVAHPWFGELSARQWHSFYVLHLWVHLRQLRAIKKRLAQ